MLCEQVLALLEQNRGRIVTGGEIARQLKVSRTAVWKTVAALREKGHEIESAQSSGYRLNHESDGLDLKAIGYGLTTEKLGRSMELLKSVDSTNTYLKRKDISSLPDGHAVIADGQTGGRGRKGRTFCSPKGNGVYISCLLKPQIPLSETAFLTICAAVAVCRAVNDVCGIKAEVKWVNDIYLDGKKLCGILTEAGVNAEMQCVDYAVVGIGVNTGDIPPEIEHIATSVYEASGVKGIRNRLAAGILNHFEQVYLGFIQDGKKQEILDEYTRRLFIIGKTVKVEDTSGGYEAEVLGVDDMGRLLVKRPDGQTDALNAGDISIMP